RGIDVEGHAVVLWAPGFEPKAVAGLASTRTYPLRSSFRPSYNMAVNLVHQVGKDKARELLESSFAQFQADRAVVGLAQQVRKAEEALEGYAEAMTCDRGDFMDYAALRRELSDRERAQSKRRGTDRRQVAIEALSRLRAGDVIDVPAGRWSGLAVVVDPGTRTKGSEGPRPLVVTADRQARRLSVVDFPTPVSALTHVRLTKTFNARNPQQRRDLAALVRERTRDLPPAAPADSVEAPEEPDVGRLRGALRAHPCHECPHREDHARWAERYFKLDRETQTLRRRIDQRTNTIARDFDRVCEVLLELGYLDGERVTAEGAGLSRIYSELDLLAAECLRRRLWQGLEAPALAAVLSALVFESRNPDDAGRPHLPGGAVTRVLEQMVHVWGELEAIERDHRLSFQRELDLGFAWAAYRWAGGASLEDVLLDVELAPGDFVRCVKQLLDLAEQVAAAATDAALQSTAREVLRSMRRGVVDYSGDL
ncbi:MAG: DEAD/DEAH box helicase, partial [Nocardioidaceae bacterium]